MMNAVRSLYIIAAGGTVDKVYSLTGALEIGDPAATWILAQGRAEIVEAVIGVVSKDSNSMTDDDRAEIAETLKKLPGGGVVITHGTDTMVDTAKYLADRGDRAAGQTVVLTGAIEPASMRNSDAPFNIGSALIAAQLLPAGVYVAMNGRVFSSTEVVKNRKSGRFVYRGEDPMSLS